MQWSWSDTQEVTQQFLAGHSDDATALWLFFCPITKLSAPHASHPPRSPFLSLLSTGNNDQQGDPAGGSLPGLLAAQCRGAPQPWRKMGALRGRWGRDVCAAGSWAEPAEGGEKVFSDRGMCRVWQRSPTPAHLPAAGMCSAPGESAAVPWALAWVCTVTTALPCYLNPGNSHPANTIPRTLYLHMPIKQSYSRVLNLL